MTCIALVATMTMTTTRNFAEDGPVILVMMMWHGTLRFMSVNGQEVGTLENMTGKSKKMHLGEEGVWTARYIPSYIKSCYFCTTFATFLCTHGHMVPMPINTYVDQIVLCRTHLYKS